MSTPVILPGHTSYRGLRSIKTGAKARQMRFAHLKTHHRFERMRLRGFSGARDEFHFAAIVQNLKTLASRLWRPPPNIPVAYLA